MDVPRANARSRIHRTAWWIVLAIVAVRMLPAISSRYMSLDGVTYATISRNMSVGIGDVWHPVYTEAVPAGVFHEHPPLAFAIESLLFRILGDHYWVEKFYSVLTTLGTGLAIWMAWRLLLRSHPDARVCSWLPVAAWILMPCWTRATANNLLENTLGLFCAWSVFAVLRAMESRRWQLIAWSSVAGVLVAAALLTKGPVGLFPLTVSLAAFLTLRQQSLGTAVLVSLVLALVAALTLAAALIPSEAREFVAIYWRQQVIASLSGHRELADSSLGRLTILWKLISEMVAPVVMACAIVWFTRRRTASGEAERRLACVARFFLLVAASASLPLAISPKQHGWYLFPSCPFYAAALAAWSLPGLLPFLRDGSAMLARIRIHRFLEGAAACLLGAVVVWRIVSGGLRQDRDLLNDVDKLGMVVPRHSILAVPSDIVPSVGWMLQADLYRRDYITLVSEKKPHQYRLAIAGPAPIPPGYVQAPLDLVGYRLLAVTRASGQQADGRNAERPNLH